VTWLDYKGATMNIEDEYDTAWYVWCDYVAKFNLKYGSDLVYDGHRAPDFINRYALGLEVNFPRQPGRHRYGCSLIQHVDRFLHLFNRYGICLNSEPLELWTFESQGYKPTECGNNFTFAVEMICTSLQLSYSDGTWVSQPRAAIAKIFGFTDRHMDGNYDPKYADLYVNFLTNL
jgi:hypothetical protein